MQSNILEYLEDSARKYPDKKAFINDTCAYSFRQILEEGQSIASYLSDLHSTKQPILVFMKRGPKVITAYMGVLYSGNYYVPIDNEMPIERINLIIEKTESCTILCDSDTYEAANKLGFRGNIIIFEHVNMSPIRKKRLLEIRSQTIDTDPIYVVFTSGSTGSPKGVIANHRSVIDYIEQLTEVLEVDSTTIFGNQTPLYLDASLKEIYSTLKYGCSTYIIPKQLFMFPIKLVAYLNEHKINTICWVVTALTMISSFKVLDKNIPLNLRIIAFGSEVFPVKQFNLWKEALPSAKFINLYGPTEGTGMCTYHIVKRDLNDDDVIPIGIPFKNTEILLITEENKQAQDNQVGEICIRGASVTMGYYKDHERTKEVYIQNPLNPLYPEIIYRTGDLGKLNAFGELVFISRRDHQIKHMGHRIELGEIEASANKISGLSSACCIYDQARKKILVFYVGDISKTELASNLKVKLPRYMLPNKIYQLAEMPLTSNGKIDRQLLKTMGLKRKRD